MCVPKIVDFTTILIIQNTFQLAILQKSATVDKEEVRGGC